LATGLAAGCRTRNALPCRATCCLVYLRLRGKGQHCLDLLQSLKTPVSLLLLSYLQVHFAEEWNELHHLQASGAGRER